MKLRQKLVDIIFPSSEEGYVITCPVCSEPFTSRPALRRHIHVRHRTQFN